jgi:acetyl esterase/lipase
MMIHRISLFLVGCCCLALSGGAELRAADAEPPAIQRDIAYGKLEQQVLDVYAPRGATNLPVMVYIHGGGWRKGDKKGSGDKEAFFTKNNWILVSANYRLGPGGRHPNNAQDIAAAIGWVHREIARYGGDPNSIFIMGHSAGAHLVSLVATDERFLKGVGLSLRHLKGCISLDTRGYDIVTLMKDTEAPVYAEAFGDDPSVYKDASPLHHVEKGKGIPPFLVCYSGGMKAGPCPGRQRAAEEFAAALRAAGGVAEVVDATDRDHGQINRRFGEETDERVTGRAMAFLNGILGRASPVKSASPVAAPGSGEKPASPSTVTWPEWQWTPSLTFPHEATDGRPLPIIAMNLTAHKGMMFSGMATSFERDRYSRASSYVYVKRAADKPWELDADFGPGTSRVGIMCSARFERGSDGTPIKGGPVEILVAFTLRMARDGESVLQARIRDDQAGRWLTVDLPLPATEKPNVRVLRMHRDKVTGADMLMVGASPSPLGIIGGTYDPSAKGNIRWGTESETTSAARTGGSKWFGMGVANGVLFASDAHVIYRRVDGPKPTWKTVAEFPRVSDAQGASIRGLTGVPNPEKVTGWPEKEMLVFGTQFAMWRMRAPSEIEGDHPYVKELDLIPWLTERLKDHVAFVEPAFNELRSIRLEGMSGARWPVGFQVVYGTEGIELDWRDESSFRRKPDAWFLLRDEQGQYALEQISPRVPADAVLYLARDFLPSPFPTEKGVLYACGYNGSYFKGSLGTAWVYRGTIKSPVKSK